MDILEMARRMDADKARNQSQFSPAQIEAGERLLHGQGTAAQIYEFATTSSQLPMLVQTIASIEVQSMYLHHRRVMREVLRTRRNVPNFNQVQAVRLDGAEGVLPAIREGGDYNSITLEQAQTDTYNITKYGGLFPITWESIKNDPGGAFEYLPARMLRGVIRTEEAVPTSWFFDSDGPIDAYFDVQPSGVSSLPLSVENLRTAVGEMSDYTDSDGDPVSVTPRFLMVPPSLKLLAMEILNSVNLNHPVDTSGSGSGTPERMGTRNVLADLNIQLLVNPWITSIVTSGTKGKTTWALFSDPAELPAGEIGTLEGFDAPQVYAPDQSSSNPTWTQNDTLVWKVKHCFGGCTLDHRAGWASVGQ